MSDYLISFLGGLLLGAAVVGYLYVHGRIAGISGLVAQILNSQTIFKAPAIWFMSGLIIIPFIYGRFVQLEIELNASPLMMIITGLLVGFGTRLGSGCTSGYDICWISRLSKRSILATMSFMFAGFVTVYMIRHVTGAF